MEELAESAPRGNELGSEGRCVEEAAALGIGAVDAAQSDEGADEKVAEHSQQGKLRQRGERLEAAQRVKHRDGDDHDHSVAVGNERRQMKRRQHQGDAVPQDHGERDAANSRLGEAGDRRQELGVGGHRFCPDPGVGGLARGSTRLGDQDETIRTKEGRQQCEAQSRGDRLGAGAKGGHAGGQRQHAGAHDVLHQVHRGLRHGAQLHLSLCVLPGDFLKPSKLRPVESPRITKWALGAKGGG
mmetsp:Transcript_28380/g.67469  ORF Transcript_28380/g.67469 Transcript_28380/m.67469 type:complete len:242 (-) Transcript_28380:44-769(-)